jgi:hypothetical protein
VRLRLSPPGITGIRGVFGLQILLNRLNVGNAAFSSFFPVSLSRNNDNFYLRTIGLDVFGDCQSMNMQEENIEANQGRGPGNQHSESGRMMGLRLAKITVTVATFAASTLTVGTGCVDR